MPPWPPGHQPTAYLFWSVTCAADSKQPTLLDNIPSLVESAPLLALTMSIFFQWFASTASSATPLAPCQALGLVQLHVWVPSTFGLYPTKGCPSIPKLSGFPIIAFLLSHHALLEENHFTLHRVVHMSLPLGSLHWHLPPRQNYVIATVLLKYDRG